MSTSGRFVYPIALDQAQHPIDKEVFAMPEQLSFSEALRSHMLSLGGDYNKEESRIAVTLRDGRKLTFALAGPLFPMSRREIDRWVAAKIGRELPLNFKAPFPLEDVFDPSRTYKRNYYMVPAGGGSDYCYLILLKPEFSV